jgi:hypothetical protein
MMNLGQNMDFGINFVSSLLSGLIIVTPPEEVEVKQF